ncbi:HAD family hydrolase [Aeromonas caviae]
MFAEVVAAMAQQGIHFAPCTGKQVERVEALLDNALGLAIIRRLERLPGEHIVIANAGVHKGTTVARLQQLVGAGRHETLVFGDGLNDIELMACADFSFAMRNGHDETKDAAHFITRSNDEDAVMHTILQLLALQRQGA